MTRSKLQIIGALTIFLFMALISNAQSAEGKFYVKTTGAYPKTELLKYFPMVEVVNVGPSQYIVNVNTSKYANVEAYNLLNSMPIIAYVSAFESHGKYFAVQKENILFKLKDNADLDMVAGLFITMGMSYPQAQKLLPGVYSVSTNKNTTIPLMSARILQSTNLFKFIEPDMLFTPVVPSTPNDPTFNRQWAIQNDGTNFQFNGDVGADMQVPQAWDITVGSPDIKIAIMDSGVDTLHPDLMANLLPGFDANTDSIDTRGYPTPTYDEDGHGTCCAGICAAVGNNGIGIAGIAYGCKIIPVRIFHYISFGGQTIPISSSSETASGITWAWQVAGADVLSNSWGVPDSLIPLLGDPQIVIDAIDAGVTQGRGGKGAAMLFSSGNDNSTTCLIPARLPNVISINATSMCDERKSPTSCDNETWWGGNYGDSIDVSAPGVKIATTDMLGSNGFGNGSYYNIFNGTSAACPNAAGVMALIYSVNPNLTFTQARYIMEYSCERVGGYDYSTQKNAGTWSQELGYGRVNAINSLNYALFTVTGVGEDKPKDFMAFIRYNEDGSPVLNMKADKPKNVTVDVYDVTGRYIQNVYSAGNCQQLSNLPLNLNAAGMYLVRVVADGQSIGLKALVKN